MTMREPGTAARPRDSSMHADACGAAAFPRSTSGRAARAASHAGAHGRPDGA